MNLIVSVPLLLLGFVLYVSADVYLHNPPGSNNRLNGKNRNRQNNNRLFDSQNNNRGGYNVGSDGNVEGEATPTFIGGSKMNIQWTNQHECGLGNTGCDIILQYMCDDTLRDGRNTGTPNDNDLEDNDKNRGRHETQQYYQDCKNRARDTNLYHADQKLKRDDARATRQNPNGARSGLECPEERDYYPYHAPSPWRDIAILTNRVDKCATYRAQSQNVIPKGFCKGANRLQPITQADCQAKGGTWYLAPKHNIPAPACQQAPKTRDNHNGNVAAEGQGFEQIPKTTSYDWDVPDVNAVACTIRIRYNISIGDYEQFSFDKSHDSPSRGNKANPTVVNQMAQEYRLPNAQAAVQREYYIKNDPAIKPMADDLGMDFQLAINTAQTGRTFEDRTHKFRIAKRSTTNIPANAPVHNLNVIGKRGNIVQVYPAVEYGFEPANLKVNRNDYVHLQWTGSLNNPRNNDGEGRQGEDKSNVVAMTNRKYLQANQPAGMQGHPANSYPLNVNTQRFLGVSKATSQKMAFPLLDNNAEQLLLTGPLAQAAIDGGTCPEESGFCVKNSGRDQNSGVVRLSRENIDTAAEEEACLKQCSSYSGATGCETIKNQGNRGCYVHTKEVARGNNARNHKCWVFSKCTGAANLAPAQPVVAAPLPGSGPQPATGLTTRTACEWSTLNLNCGAQRIQVTGANYGRTSNSMCSRNRQWPNTDCGARSSMTVVQNACQNRQSCRVRARNDVFGDPCPGTFKYLSVTYRCVNLGRKDETENVEKQLADAAITLSKDDVTQVKEKEVTPVIADVVAAQLEADIEADEKITFRDTLDNIQDDIIKSDEEFADILQEVNDTEDEDIVVLEKRGRNGNAAKLDNAPAYVNIGPIKAEACGTYNYLCTRNNNFSNRSQKGKVQVC